MTSSGSNPICGVWIDDDDDTGQKIAQYIRIRSNRDVVRADLKNFSFLQSDATDMDGLSYSQYIVLISKESCHRKRSHNFMLFLTSVLYQLHYMKLISRVVLVMIDDKVKEKHLPINLNSFDKIRCNASDEKSFDQICDILAKPTGGIEAILPVGNVGIGLAWSYYYGYLALILPGIGKRIEDSKPYADGKMNKQFIIIIPKSCRTPSEFKEADNRISFAGPLDEGFIRSRAGHPGRMYKNFVQKFKLDDKQGDFYFCGEFATPVWALEKMLDDPLCNMDDQEMRKQMELFRHTLMSILNHESNAECKGQAHIYTYNDSPGGARLADELHRIIKGSDSEGSQDRASDTASQDSSRRVSESTTLYPVQTDLTNSTNTSHLPSEISSYVVIKRLAIVNASHDDDESLRWADAVAECWNSCYGDDDPGAEKEDAEQGGFAVCSFDSLVGILPPIKNPSIVDNDPEVAEKAVLDKLMVIFTEGTKEDVTKYADQLISSRVWFPRTTFIVDLPEESIPDWLEKSGADYIDTRKYDSIWNRIFGSFYGTSSVAGTEDQRWQRFEEDIQYQVDRLPVGRVAEGLAWSFYHNYLTLVGPTFVERVKKSKWYAQKRMPTKLFLLLPFSCYSYPTLSEADSDIVSAGEGSEGKLEQLKIQIAGNYRNYDTPVIQIEANGQPPYFACVEYCPPVLVKYEMEAEGKAGLSPVQKSAQLYIFYQVLKGILEHPRAPPYCKDIQLIYYKDQLGGRKLSEVILEQIKRWL